MSAQESGAERGLGAGPFLVTGAGGMLGRAWGRLLGSCGKPLTPLRSADLDVTDPAAVERAIDGTCPVVVNCAAWTDVDGAEASEEEAAAVNGDGAGFLARRCAAVGAVLVHFSTDYLFDGAGREPIAVDQPIKPIGAYGRSKAEGERQIRESGCEHLIVRTSWLYAPWGKNFVKTIAGAARRRDTLTIVDDQVGRPTSAEHLARSTARLLDAGARGVYHVCDGGTCSWYDFGVEIVRLVGASCDVQRGKTADLGRPAPRPAYSVLDLSATEAVIGPMPHWRENLAAVIARLEPDG